MAAVFLLFALALAFRLKLVTTYHSPAGDGLQYYVLSQELARADRYAYGPPPAALTYTRLPGYPLFLAYVAVRKAGIGLERHLIQATRWNVLCDFGSALLVGILLGGVFFQTPTQARRNAARRLCGAILVLGCPLIFLHSCYALTESLATFLSTLQVVLALRLITTRWPLVLACAIGVCAGCSLLVRLDALTALPAVALGLWRRPADSPSRLGLAALIGLLALSVYTPWPLRNLARFGQTHMSAGFWRTAQGQPLPDEPIRWERTWACGHPGETYIDLSFVYNANLDVEKRVLPAMYDSPAERTRLERLFHLYNRERFSTRVVSQFATLASERTQRAPLRTLFWLPLCRAFYLWSPVPEYELPLRAEFLGLPSNRWVFGVFDKITFLLALLGAFVLGLRGERDLLWLFLVSVVARTLVVCYASPFVHQRYLIELMPLILGLSSCGLILCAEFAFGGLRRLFVRQRPSRSAPPEAKAPTTRAPRPAR